jgi:hypothetical protein
LLASALDGVGEIIHLRASRFIALAEPGRGVMRCFVKTIALRLHRL